MVTLISWLGGEYGSEFSQFISKEKLHQKTLISRLGGKYGHFDQMAGGGVDGDLQKVKVVYLVKSGLFQWKLSSRALRRLHVQRPGFEQTFEPDVELPTLETHCFGTSPFPVASFLKAQAKTRRTRAFPSSSSS